MRRAAALCASARDGIALRERRASTTAIQGVDRLRRNVERFICGGFHLVGRTASRPAGYIVLGARRRKAARVLPLFWGLSRGSVVRSVRFCWRLKLFKGLGSLLRNSEEVRVAAAKRDTPSIAC